MKNSLGWKSTISTYDRLYDKLFPIKYVKKIEKRFLELFNQFNFDGWEHFVCHKYTTILVRRNLYHTAIV